MDEAIAKKTQQWEKEKPQYPENDAQRAELAKEKADLEATIKKQEENENKTQYDQDELALNEKKLDYYDQVIKQFDFTQQYEKTKNPEDKNLADNAAQERKILNKDIIQKIAQDIQNEFNPADGGQTEKTNLLSKAIETIQTNILQPIKNAIDKLFTQAVSRGELSPKQAETSIKKAEKKSVTIGGGTDVSPQLPPNLKPKAVADRLDLWITAYNRPENLNAKPLYKKFITDYINKLANADIDYTIQHQKNPEGIKAQHDSIVAALEAIGIDQAQIDLLNNYKNNAVQKITAEFKTPETKKQAIDFFNTQNNSGEFNITAYQKLANETSKLDVKNGIDLQKLRDNIAKLRSTADVLHNYATYALDELPVKTQITLLDFLQDQQILLARYYDNISLSPYLAPEDLNTVLSNARSIGENLDATRNRLIGEGEQNRIKFEKRLEVQKLIKDEEAKGLEPINNDIIKAIDTGVPDTTRAFTELLVSANPLDSQVRVKFDTIVQGIDSFVESAGKADPSSKAVLAEERILAEISDLQDWLTLYNDTTALSSAEQKQLVQYYKDLDVLYAKVGAQGIKDMNNLFKTLSDGTPIYLEQAKRATPSQETIKALEWQQKSPALIEAWFKQGRLNVTTSEDISGV